MSEGFEIVDRPAGINAGRLNATSVAVAETLITGKAVRLPLNGKTQSWFSSRFSTLCASRNARVRTKRDGDSVLVWLIPRETK